MPEVVLSVRKLSKRYGETLAVDELSFDVHRGEVFGFLGPNGAGKTTSIHIICGLMKSDAGEIQFHLSQVPGSGGSWKRQLGLCPETLVIWDSLTCSEQLIFIGQQYDLSYREASARTHELLAHFGLLEKRRALANTLSGGMKRRLNLALALVHDPELLILDEPQAGLDPQSRILVRETIRSMAPERTVILTSHDMDEVDRLADRVGIIDRGRLLVLDTPANLKNRIGAGDILEIKLAPGQQVHITQLEALLPEALRPLKVQDETLQILNVSTLEWLPALLEILQRAQIEIEDLVVRKKTLEDVFIDLTGRRLRA